MLNSFTQHHNLENDTSKGEWDGKMHSLHPIIFVSVVSKLLSTLHFIIKRL